MTNYIKLSHIDSPTLRKLIWSLYAITLLGLAFSAISFIATGTQENYFSRNLCFSNKCLKIAFSAYSETITILQVTTLLLGLIASVGGIIVALMSYANSVSVSALGNHIAHFKIFQEYICIEIGRRDRVSLSSIDIFKLYNCIFDKSRTGRTSISKGYVAIIDNLNLVIIDSNSKSIINKGKSFSYSYHQISMISVLKSFGINQTRLPRNDFYEVESQILELIECLNMEFCYTSEIPKITKRIYI